jgi:methylated-DNA-protein-cysteine methyltransferase-like protein
MMSAVMPKPAAPIRPALSSKPRADVAERELRAAAILAIVREIPRGRVTTYGSVAARAGLPRQARLVGKVLSGLPQGSGVPWHRVVAAGGRIAFPDGSSSRDRQLSRLRAERVDVTRGRIDLARYGWGATMGDLDQWLWSRGD